VAGVVFAARKLVPPILLYVVRARSRELFLTLLLVLCLGTAYLTSLAGLSLALGAFLGGLAIGESEYSHQALAEALPFRDAFGMLFFVSIGMLMDVRFAMAELPIVALVVAGILLLKTLTAALPVMLLGYPAPVALHAGLALAQIGEFAFVLSRSGRELGLVGARDYQIFLSASVVTMLLTPALLAAGRALSLRMPETARLVPWRARKDEHSEAHASLRDHVIIAGYGVNGQNVSRALRASGIPYVVLEMNPESVDAARARQEPIHYGDCTRLPVLREAGIERARMFVVAISDAASTRQAVSIARTEKPDLHVLVRTRFVSEVDELKALGADEVIPEEFETSIEIFARVLQRFEIPRNRVLELVDQVRGGAYEMLRGAVRPGKEQLGHAALRDVHVDTLLIRRDAEAVGRSLAELDLRARFGLTVLAVQRGEHAYPNPGPDLKLLAEDLLVVMGDPAAMDRAIALVEPSAKQPS
jgi:CPA2 family monovalent cation:H+ antiporter-2